MFNFEKLGGWKRMSDFAAPVSRATQTFPAGERFQPTNRVRRAAVSVSSSLAEGFRRSSRTDHARFVRIATGSLSEVVPQAGIAKQRESHETIFLSTHREAEGSSRRLSGLRHDLISAEGTRRADQFFNSQL